MKNSVLWNDSDIRAFTYLEAMDIMEQALVSGSCHKDNNDSMKQKIEQIRDWICDPIIVEAQNKLSRITTVGSEPIKFSILFELEKRVDLSGRTRYQKRMFGFMAERLFNVYLHHNRKILKLKCIPISEPDEVIFSTQKFSMQREIKYIVKKIINYENMYR